MATGDYAMTTITSIPTHTRYDRFSVLLHWLMAALLIAELGLGLCDDGAWFSESGLAAG